MAVDAGRRFRIRPPIGLRPVMLRAGLALAILALALVAMTAKAADRVAAAPRATISSPR